MQNDYLIDYNKYAVYILPLYDNIVIAGKSYDVQKLYWIGQYVIRLLT